MSICVCVSVGHVRVKMAEPIEMLFGRGLIYVDLRNHVSDGASDSRGREHF